MSRWMAWVAFWVCLSGAAWAEVPLPRFELGQLGLNDQWEKPLKNPGQVAWVLAAADMTAHAAVKERFDELGAEWLDQRGLIYVADISGMPGLITTMFALPKMQKYSYPIYLDREGDLIASWRIPEEKFLLLRMESGRPVSVRVVADFEALEPALETP